MTRKAVIEHAARMEEVLKKHDTKKPWDECSLNYLAYSIWHNHQSKLNDAVADNDYDEIVKQATHISNYCMMLADNANRIQQSKINPERL